MEHKDQPTFKIPNVVRQYATDILLKYPDITITEMEKFLRNKFQLDLTKDQIRYAAYQLMLKPNGESLMKENAKYDYNLISKGSNKWIIQVKYGTKVVDEQLFTGTETEARYKGQKNVDYFEVRHKPGMNSKGYYESIAEEKNSKKIQMINDKDSYIRKAESIISSIHSLKREILSKNRRQPYSQSVDLFSAQAVTGMMAVIDSLKNETIVNSKSYYESIIEKKNANTWFKGHTPEDDAKRLTALEPIVKSLKRKGMSPKDIAIELEKKTRPELARQAVQAFYD